MKKLLILLIFGLITPGVFADSRSKVILSLPYAVFYGSMTESERIDATKIAISSVATFEGLINDKVNISSVSVFEGLINNKLNASSGTIVVPYTVFYGSMTNIQGTYATNSRVDNLNWYTTSTICCMFASTDTTGDLQVSSMTVPIPTDCTVISWYMNCDVADTVSVSVSSGAFGKNLERICGTDYVDAVAQTDSSDTALSGWSTSLGVGGWVRFVLLKASASRNITVGLIVKKWAR